LLGSAAPTTRRTGRCGAGRLAGWAGFGPVRSAPISLFFFFYLSVLKYCFSFRPLKQPIKIRKKIVKIPVAP
jgi:hypothetical protein